MWIRRVQFLRAPDDAGAQQQTGQQQTGQPGNGGGDKGTAPPASIFDLAGGDGGDGGDKSKSGDAGSAPDGVTFADWVPANFRRDKPVELTADQLKMLQHVDIEGLARSQADLRTKLGTGAYKPPAKADEYAFEMPQGVDLKIDAGDPVMAAFKTNALAAGLSKEQFAKLAAPMIASMAEIAAKQGGAKLTPEQLEQRAKAEKDEQVKAFEAEIAKLGPNGQEAVRQTGKWLKGLETRGVLTTEEFAALRSVSNADGVMALRKLMDMTGEKPMPIDMGEATTDLSVQDAKALLTAAHMKLNKDPKDAKGLADRKRAIAALERYEKSGQLGGPVYG